MNDPLMTRRNCLATLLTSVAATSAWAQPGWPSKPVKIITPFGAGQGPDVLLRMVADKLQAAWGQAVLIDNRPGASGFIAFQAARNSPADGYTLVNMDSFHVGTHPHLFKKLPYDAFKDFTPITPLVRNYFFIVVPAKSKWKNVGDLIAAAKAQSGTVSFGSWGVATPAHLGGMLLETTAGIQMLHVPFKEPSQLYQAVASGEVDWAYGTAVSTKALLDAGKLRLLAVAAPRRIPGYESVPTVAESGGPAKLEVAGWNGLLAPTGTPRDIVGKINEGVQAAMSSPDIREKLNTFTYERYTMSPAEMAQVMEREVRNWGPIVKASALKLD